MRQGAFLVGLLASATALAAPPKEPSCVRAEAWLLEAAALRTEGRPARAERVRARAYAACPALSAQVARDAGNRAEVNRSTATSPSLSELVDRAWKVASDDSLTTAQAEALLLELRARTGETPELVPAVGSEESSELDVAWLAGDRRVAVASDIGVSIFTVPELREVARLPFRVETAEGNSARIASAPDRPWLVVAGRGGPIALYDTDTLSFVRDIAPLGAPQVTFSPNGRWLVTVEAEGAPILRRTQDFSVARRFMEPPPEETNDGFVLIRFSDDSRVVAFLELSGRITRYDVASGRLLGQTKRDETGMAGFGLNPLSAEFSPDLSYLTHGVPGSSLVVRDARSGALVNFKSFYSCHNGVSANAIVAMPDGRRFVSAGAYPPYASLVNIIDRRTLKPEPALPTAGFVRRLALSRDGRWLLGAGTSMALWDLRSRQLSRRSLDWGPEANLGASNRTEQVWLSPKGRVAALSPLVFWEGEGPGTTVPKTTPWLLGSSLRFAETDGIWGVSTHSDVQFFDRVTRTELWLSSPASGFVLSADGSRGAYAEYRALRLWDNRKGALLATLQTDAIPNFLGGSLDRGYLSFMIYDQVFVYSVRENRAIATGIHRQSPKGLAAVDEGRRIVIASDQGLELIERQNPSRSQLLEPDASRITQLTADPSMRFVVAQYQGSSLSGWSAEGRKLFSYTAPSSQERTSNDIVGIQFTSDGEYLTIELEVGRAVVLSTRTGKEALTLSPARFGRGAIARAPGGEVELFGEGNREALACRIGPAIVPLALCLEELGWPGMTREVLAGAKN